MQPMKKNLLFYYEYVTLTKTLSITVYITCQNKNFFQNFDYFVSRIKRRITYLD